MSVAHVESLAASWIEFERTPEIAPEWEARRSIVFEIDRLCTHDPDEAWAFVLAVLARESDEEVLGVLAAGPLEDLLSRNGPGLIDRVESEAARNAAFRALLRGLYQLHMGQEVWQRVQAAAQEPAT